MAAAHSTVKMCKRTIQANKGAKPINAATQLDNSYTVNIIIPSENKGLRKPVPKRQKDESERPFEL